MKDLIKNLQNKNYVRAFGLMSKVEQEMLKEIGMKNCIYYYDTGEWIEQDLHTEFLKMNTYAIKPDYQPEPEYVDVEITEFEQDSGKWLGVLVDDKSEFLPYKFTHLHCLSSLPNFHDFWYEPGTVRFNFSDYGRVASLKDLGNKVYARFRKGGDTNASIKS